MNTAQVAHVRAHVAAVAKLVLGDKIIKPSMSIIAGEPLDAVGRLRLGEIVQVDSKSQALTAGIARAEQRLAALVRDGVDVDKQVIMHDWC